jgi:OOP family OmpA-OmpF porin
MSKLALLVCLVSSLALADRVTYKIENGELKVPHAVTYATGGAKLQASSTAALGYVKGYLDEKSYVSTLRIEVHSDTDGDAKSSQVLTTQRALAVAKALVAKGLDCKRLVAVGFGGTKPVAANDTAEGKAANRRTMFVHAALRGRPIGGMPIHGGGVVAGDPCAK